MVAVGQPSRVGKYELLAEIGKGGMATVFRARLRVAGVADKPVSLKLLHQHLAGERDFLLLFLNEMRVAMGMSHRNIVQTFDAGEEQGFHFMVMELVQGCTLGQLLARLAAGREWLPIELALFVGMEVCAALDYAHNHPTGEGKIGVFHRDVSPSNVLLSDQGDVKLADFGVAKAAGRLTVVGDAIKGKLGYMAPEQGGGGTVDGRSDLFSLGAVLYEALTGRPMRSDPSLDTVIYHRASDVVSPSRYRGELPAAVDQLLLACLARDPARRPASARALRDQLAAAAFELQRASGSGFDLQMGLRQFLRDRLQSSSDAGQRSDGQTARVLQAMLDQAREIPTDPGTLSGDRSRAPHIAAETEPAAVTAGGPLEELPTLDHSMLSADQPRSALFEVDEDDERTKTTRMPAAVDDGERTSTARMPAAADADLSEDEERTRTDELPSLDLDPDESSAEDQPTGVAALFRPVDDFDAGRLSRRWPLVLAGGLLLLAAIALTIWIASGPATQHSSLPPDRTAPVTAPQDAAATPTAVGIPAGPDAAPALSSAPDLASEREDAAAAARGQRDGQVVRLRGRRRRPPRKKGRVVRPARGWLDVNAAPWARVYIDGQYRGDTPLQNIALPAGRHRLRLVNPRLKRSRSFEVTIKANQRHRQAVRLAD